MNFDEYEAATDEFFADPANFVDRASVVRAQRIKAKVEHGVTAAVARFEASGQWSEVGARSATRFLAKQCRLPTRQVARQVRRATELDKLPVMAEYWKNGALSGAHFDVVARLRTPRTQEALARDEKMLAECATKLTFKQFVAACRYWDLHADPDGAEASEMERQGRRGFSFNESFNGMYFTQGTFDPTSGAIIFGELDRIERELFAADWAEAEERLGRRPLRHELRRTKRQRWADALVEMAKRSMSTPPGSAAPKPLFSVLIGYDTLWGAISEFEHSRFVVPPTSLVPYLDEALFERIIFRPGVRAECSDTSRFFTGATRRAIEVRDRECAHPYCEEPGHICQCDHIQEWSKDGPTTQENGRLMCPFHNRARNHLPPEDPDAEPDGDPQSDPDG